MGNLRRPCKCIAHTHVARLNHTHHSLITIAPNAHCAHSLLPADLAALVRRFHNKTPRSLPAMPPSLREYALDHPSRWRTVLVEASRLAAYATLCAAALAGAYAVWVVQRHAHAPAPNPSPLRDWLPLVLSGVSVASLLAVLVAVLVHLTSTTLSTSLSTAAMVLLALLLAIKVVATVAALADENFSWPAFDALVPGLRWLLLAQGAIEVLLFVNLLTLRAHLMTLAEEAEDAEEEASQRAPLLRCVPLPLRRATACIRRVNDMCMCGVPPPPLPSPPPSE